MSDDIRAQHSEAARAAAEAHGEEAAADQELTEEDLGAVDGGEGGQTTYPPYL
jgi:hypothetical protein